MQASCQCGAVTFSTSAAHPTHFWLCHCTECQSQSGSAFAASAIFPYFEPPTSNASLRKWTRSSESGNTLDCYFCKECGTRLIHQTLTPDGKEKDHTTVRAGTLDDRVNLPWTTAPHIWTRSALVGIPKGVMTYPEQPDEDSVAEIQKQQESYFKNM